VEKRREVGRRVGGKGGGRRAMSVAVGVGVEWKARSRWFGLAAWRYAPRTAAFATTVVVDPLLGIVYRLLFEMVCIP